MRYADHLRVEGWCSIVLGLALAALAAPGLETVDLWALLAVPATALLLAAVGRRAGAAWGDVGGWLTTRPLRSASAGRPAIDTTRRLVVETTIWIVAVGAWVLLAGESHGLVFGTGLASALFGAVQVFASRPRVLEEERRSGRELLVAERPALGLPRLTTA